MSGIIKGGLVDARKMRNEIAREQLRASYQRCIEKISNLFPTPVYTEEQQDEMCDFVIENRSQLMEMGYQNSQGFINMFLQMIDNLVSKENISHTEAFVIVMRASYRFINNNN